MEFIKRHRSQMEYPRFIADGLKINSGSIKSPCKSAILARLKVSGMRWSRKGAVSMVVVRTALFSDLWDDVVSVLTSYKFW